MKPLKKVGYASLLLVTAATLGTKHFPEATQDVFAPLLPNDPSVSQHYDLVEDNNLVEGSAKDGDFLVRDGDHDITVTLCGNALPAIDQSHGLAARDRLQEMLAQGNGRITLVPVSTDQDNRLVAEAFVLLSNTEEEIHLNSRLIAEGLAYPEPVAKDSCPNAEP